MGEKIVVCDIETTCLKPTDYNAAIFEICCAFMDGHELQEVKTWQIETELSPNARSLIKRLRGLKELPPKVWTGEPLGQVARDMKKRLSAFFSTEYSKDWSMIAFNAEFEKSWLARKPFIILGGAWKYCLMLNSMVTMKEAGALQYNEFYNSYKWPKLSETLDFFKIVNEFAHTAEGDVMAEVAVLRRLMEDIGFWPKEV